MKIEFKRGPLTPEEQGVVEAGFAEHSAELGAPDYDKVHLKWLAVDENENLQGIATADVLWDWLYVDELWVCADARSTGLGRRLMQDIETFAADENLQGIWLWTQSWQAESFYRKLGYEEFTRFEDFPKGYTRIGFRKLVT